MAERSVRLRKPLEKVLAAGHPWVYRDALERFDAPVGATVTVLSRGGAFVARGYANEGPIAVRLLATSDEPVDASFWQRRVQAASELRFRLLPADTTAYRLLHGEGDRLSGFVCDVYGEHAVLQLDGAGARALRDQVLPALRQVLGERGVTTLLLRHGRGDDKRVEVIEGTLPREPVTVKEHGMLLLADLVSGQKTGMFVDHRQSRARVRTLASQQRVLNLYSYTGGFSVAAALGGASHVTSVDVAPQAIALCTRNFELNGLHGLHGLNGTSHAAICADVFDHLKADTQSYDLVIADPPSFAPSEEALDRALASYLALHQAALTRVRDGGLYLAASCSSHVTRALFEQTLSDAARSSGHVLQVLERDGAPFDHPRLLGFPEGDYLKVILVRVFKAGRRSSRSVPK